MTLILQAVVIACSAAILGIAARAFRRADQVSLSPMRAAHPIPSLDCRAPRLVLARLVTVEGSSQRSCE